MCSPLKIHLCLCCLARFSGMLGLFLWSVVLVCLLLVGILCNPLFVCSFVRSLMFAVGSWVFLAQPILSQVGMVAALPLVTPVHRASEECVWRGEVLE